MTQPLTVTCDGNEYEITASTLEAASATAHSAWVIQARGHYIGTFDLSDPTDERLRSAACDVIRNGSTSFHPIPPRK